MAIGIAQPDRRSLDDDTARGGEHRLQSDCKSVSQRLGVDLAEVHRLQLKLAPTASNLRLELRRD